MRKLFAVLLMCAASAVASAQPDRLPAAKKLIEYGWDMPTPAFVAENIRQMEKRPFDGLIMITASKRYGNVFMGKWDAADLADDLAAMQKIHWEKFKTNFLLIHAASDQDWFSDADWANVINNVEILARCAKAGGCNLAFDAEPYGDSPWTYAKQKHAKEKSFAQYAAKVRERGRQFIEAIGGVIPDNVMLTCFTYSIFASEANIADPAKRDEALSRKSYGLYLPFLNGMLEGLGPRMTLIDGNESSYYYDSSEKFLLAYHAMRQEALNLVPRELVPKFQTNTQASGAVYMDYLYGKMGREVQPALKMTPEEQARWFEFNTYWALRSADEFVWCYNERLDWWQDKDIPPGLEQAIINARTAIAEHHRAPPDIRPLMESLPSRPEPAAPASGTTPAK
jgi:hypothetical protein